MQAEQIYCKRRSKLFPATISVLGKAKEGISQPNLVLLNCEHKCLLGYQKTDGNPFCLNEMEYAVSLLGEVLSIPMAKILRVYSDSNCNCPHSIISLSVTQNTNEYFVSFRQMRDELFWDLKDGTLATTDWITSWSKIRARRGSVPGNEWEVEAIALDDYIHCLRFPFEIAQFWTAKYGLTLRNFGESIERMVAFDILVGQADRTPSNYGLIVNRKTRIATLAPLIDSGTLRKPYVCDSQNGFNQMLLDRECLLSTALSVWGSRFSSFLCSIAASENTITRNIYENSDVLGTADMRFLQKRICNSLKLIRKYTIPV